MEKYPPEQYGERKRRRDCIGAWQARYRDPDGKQKSKNFPISEGGKKAAEAFLDEIRTESGAGVQRPEARRDHPRGVVGAVVAGAAEAGGHDHEQEAVSNWNAHIEPKWGSGGCATWSTSSCRRGSRSEVKGYHTRKKVHWSC
jgi:hypothetical protein